MGMLGILTGAAVAVFLGIDKLLHHTPDMLQHGSVVAGNRALHRWLMNLLRTT